MSHHRYILVALCLSVTIGAPADAQEAAEAAQQRLDYLRGSWDSITEFYDAEGNVVRTNRSVLVVEPFLGDEVLVTTSIGPDGTIRKTLRFYDRADQRFYEISVGRAGDVWMLSGSMDAYVMTSQERPSSRGGTVMVRFTHVNIQPDAFQAVMDVSRDGGATWTRANRREFLTRRTSSAQ